MTSFKTWLSEIALSSDGVTDNQITQTGNSTIQVTNNALGNPKNRDDINNFTSTQNVDQARNLANDLALNGIDQAPDSMASLTNVGKVAPQMAIQLNRPDLFPNFRLAAMKKKMQKRMKKK